MRGDRECGRLKRQTMIVGGMSFGYRALNIDRFGIDSHAYLSAYHSYLYVVYNHSEGMLISER